ncbi:MAG: hypothetical protein EPN57_27255 [Paraburkholderia sp.]|nr:MAG: hypothetical protein EPN57_27255 [Paraburkholderia sp.]
MEGLAPQKQKLKGGRRGNGAIPDDSVITYAVGMLDAADAAEVNVSPAALERYVGLAQPSRTRRAIEATRKALPGLKTEGQRIAKVEEHLQQRAEGKAADDQQAAVMETWFDGLSDAQRNAVFVAPAAEGGPNWLQPLKLRVHGEPSLEFNAEHLVEWPAGVIAQLPQDAQAMLAARQKMLSALNIESGPEAAAFVEEHFEQQRFDLNDAAPQEVARLVELHPELAPILHGLQREGAQLTFIRSTKTPDAVLDAMRHVANSSQHNFISTWFRDFVEAGVEPTVTDDDLAKVREDNAKSKRVALTKFKDDPFRSALATRQHDGALEDALDVRQSIDLIKDFSKGAMSVAVASSTGGNEARLDQVNHSLNELFGREYARRRMTFDDANRTSEGAKAIITSLAVLAPVVELLEKGLNLGPVAKAVAAAGDDAAAESAEISALKEAGVSNQELLQRVAIAGPAAVLSLGMAGSIDEVVKELGDHAGGAMYSTSAVFLSFVTSVLSIQYFAKNYKRLERENKLPPDLVLDEKTRALLDKVDQEKISKRDLLRIVDQSLEKSGATQEERTVVHARLSRFNQRKLLRALGKEGRLSMRQNPLVAGVKEAVGVNPARLGLMAGTLSSPVVGYALGPWFLHQPVLYAIAGSFETIVGAMSIWAYGRSFDSRWKRFVRRRESVDSPRSTQGEGGIDGTQAPQALNP